MAYRNGTYTAFNGCNTTDPIKSDIKYYNIIKAWNNNDDIDFDFVNSHDKTYAVLDSSRMATLKNRLQERMRNSKNMLLIITENSNANRGLLEWEIQQCVEIYKLPIIIAFTMCSTRLTNTSLFSKYLPDILRDYIRLNKVKTISVPYKKEPLLTAISYFSTNQLPEYTDTVYSASAYEKWGIF